jgi:hypothetical protein
VASSSIDALELGVDVFALTAHLHFGEGGFHTVHALFAPGGGDEAVDEVAFDTVKRLEAVHVLVDVLQIFVRVFPWIGG